MSRELICSWLKLAPDKWPPDHYTLLGLKPGETDAGIIGQHVQEKHEVLLRYQLTHPEPVTEAMNRLAQAYNCLSDAGSKQAYDAVLLPQSGKITTKTTPTVPPAENLPADPLAWLEDATFEQSAKDTFHVLTIQTQEAPALAPAPAPTATPAASPPAATPPAVPPTPAATAETYTMEPVPVKPLPPPAKPVAPAEPDPAMELACSCLARRGLLTRWALFQRIASTRILLRAWVQVGKYLGDPTLRLTRKDQAIDLVRQLTIIRQQLQSFPALIGQAGQPGYLVISLARQQLIVQTFLTLLPAQREALVRDWQAGLTFLAAHRYYVREEIWKVRRSGWLGRTIRGIRRTIADRPIIWLATLALIGLNIWVPFVRNYWLYQTAAGVGLLLAYWIISEISVRRSWLDRSRRHDASQVSEKPTPAQAR